jgi:hypothetical protein
MLYCVNFIDVRGTFDIFRFVLVHGRLSSLFAGTILTSWNVLWRLKMLQNPIIEQTARLRRYEIAHEFSKLRFSKKAERQGELERREAMDLNIRVSLQPRLSFSIWVGRGA